MKNIELLIILLIALVLAILSCPMAQAGERPLRIYCVYHAAHGFRSISRHYEKRAGVSLQLPPHCRDHFTPTAESLKEGDLYLTTSRASMAKAREDGLLDSGPQRIGRVVPIIAVMKGNPRKIHSLAELSRKGLVVAYPSTCIGNVALAIVHRNKLDDTVKPNMTIRTGNRTGVLNPLVGGKAHAAITWNCAIIESGRKDLDVIPIPQQENIIDPLLIATLKSSPDQARARAFLNYLAGKPAKEILRAHCLGGEPAAERAMPRNAEPRSN
ncbi:substrate-binding domain-containing protein [bacterium]|nr:substrate-binding domain-containing protein [bacterium]